MAFTRQFVLSESAGRRPQVPGVVVIIADEKSADDLSRPAAVVRASGESLMEAFYCTECTPALPQHKHTTCMIS